MPSPLSLNRADVNTRRGVSQVSVTESDTYDFESNFEFELIRYLILLIFTKEVEVPSKRRKKQGWLKQSI
jgi:hypothetical protein